MYMHDTNVQHGSIWCLHGASSKPGGRHHLVQPEESPLKDGQGLGVDGFSMVGPASCDVPPASVSFCQRDTQRVWQEQQCQNEAHHIEGSGGPELVPAHSRQCTLHHS